jgi:ABC-type branched-subunit amino acid transport system ATPase component
MITRLALKNFRCFREFSLEGISPVTLIAGANNVGKSTVLESIFLFMDRNHAGVFFKLNGFRGINLSNPLPETIWEHLFADMDTSKSIVISLVNDEQEQSLTISKNDSLSLAQASETPLRSNISAGTVIYNRYPLEICYKDRSGNDISHAVLTEAGLSIQPAIRAETPYIHYIGANVLISPSETAEWLSRLDLKGERDKCVKILQKTLEPRIKDLSVAVVGGINGIYADIGLPTRLPINMLGGGINKLMHIVLIMLANPGAVLLIDEIENGFHYSLFPKLWEIVGKLTGETGCQVFATTHSYECISGATELAADDANSDLFRFIRLDWEGGIVVPHVFENDSFEYAIHNDWEVR